MAFAKINFDLSYWQKQNQPLFSDLLWNVPERKTGHLAVVGGNQQNFATTIRISEYVSQHFPLETVVTFLPDTLRNQLPTLPNIFFCASTTTGSFAKSAELQKAFADYQSTLLIGDLSKNSATTIALSEAISRTVSSDRAPQLTITRDAVDSLISEMSNLLTRPNTFMLASMLQLQKIFRSVFYPKMILLAQPLVSAIETLHKFTLTYPTTIITLHQDQIIVAHHGQISTTHLVDTAYSPLSIWSGQLAANLTALNLYNPTKPFEASTAAILAK